MVSNATDSFDILGLRLDPMAPSFILQYSLLNALINSVIPVPLAGPMAVAAAALYGIVGGLLICNFTAVLGAYIGLVLTRTYCRPCIMRRLGRYTQQWQRLDAAIVAQEAQISLLIRVAPVSPTVMTNILLSLTSIKPWVRGRERHLGAVA